jgi:polyisoprenoid-binding protein YceI
MNKRFLGFLLAVTLACTFVSAGSGRAADNFAVDSVHSSVAFKISHLGLAWIHGRFNDFSGNFTIDAADPAKCAFALEIKAATVDTRVGKRDDHLRSPDFFDVKQFPAISFKSTAVKKVGDYYEVTGNFTMHGVTKPLTLKLVGGGMKKFGGGERTGYSTELALKRSDYGMGGMLEMLGDEVHIDVSFEGVKK